MKVNRPGVSVRHRPGYYHSEIVPSDENTKTAAIREAVWSPLDATEVSIDAQLESGDSSFEALVLRLRVDAGDLTLEQRAGRWMGQIDLALVQTDEKGTEYEVRLQTVPLQLTEDAYNAVTKDGLILSKTVQRKKDATALRVVVCDAPSGALGRAVIPFASVRM